MHQALRRLRPNLRQKTARHVLELVVETVSQLTSLLQHVDVPELGKCPATTGAEPAHARDPQSRRSISAA